MVRVGIIGTGRHGSRYAGHIQNDVDGLELVAISRRSEQGREQARQWHCSWYRDWRDLVAAPEVEAVISVVPPAFNLEIARSCAAATKPLLVEKPLAARVAEGEAMVALATEGKNRFTLTVGQTLRYNQVIRGLRRHLPEFGSLYCFSANQRLEPSTLSWHEEPSVAGAGVSFHTAVHVFDALRFITDLEVHRVMAVTRQQHNASLEDLVAVLVEMENGVAGTLDCSKVGRARSGRFEFICENGQLHGEQIYNQLERIQGTRRVSLDPGPAVSTIVPLLRDWHDFLSGTADNPVNGEDGLQALRCCAACLESARRQQWVDIPRR
ncbi:oxidoreductase [Desulfolithobacter dissulfuricans]|uniref:Oxidoreductase n=1 Tax=Desulfolithobacter dissulfuricans TaxID=2795293 RepID=A0A915UAX6_9BACT|nr:Gfo/Idh/MocA family oxidoreductase [Desulfolithobacter dissulfuricans]BCO10055.1 oxidoreductase [Desulfolithobacter dissulfuricans]